MALQIEIKSSNSKELVEKIKKAIIANATTANVKCRKDKLIISLSDSIGKDDLTITVDYGAKFTEGYIGAVPTEDSEEKVTLEKARKIALNKIDAIHAELRENIGGENWNEELEITKEKIGIMYNKMQCIQKLEKICGETLTAEYTMLDIEREDLIERKYYIDKKLNELSSLRYILRVLGEDENPDPNALM